LGRRLTVVSGDEREPAVSEIEIHNVTATSPEKSLSDPLKSEHHMLTRMYYKYDMPSMHFESIPSAEELKPHMAPDLVHQ